jgi:hypothetical protein
VWDAADGRELARLNHDDGVLRVVFSPDGTCIATASSGERQTIGGIVGGFFGRTKHRGCATLWGAE